MNITKIPKPLEDASLIPTLFAEEGVEYHTLDCVNWSEMYPYHPRVEVAVAHNGDAVLLHYRVEEQSVRAVAQADQDAVWEDSCVEFFSVPCAEDGIYYNVECNCAGKVLLGAGATRHNRERASKEITDRILRWTTLGTAPFEERQGNVAWQLALIVPKEAYFKHSFPSLDGLQIKCNIYKCGDKLSVPHFVSLFPIATERPDFHRPEYFR